MRSASVAMALLLPPLCAIAAPPSAPPLRYLDEHGRPAPDALRPAQLDGNFERPQLVRKVWPEPFHSRVCGLVIESIIDQRGGVCAARLLKGRGSQAESILAAVKRWEFKPARLNGRPVTVYFNIKVDLCPH